MAYALTFFLALVIVVIATPVSMKIAARCGAISLPGGRHIHTKPIPCLGGVAIYIAFWLAFLSMRVWDEQILGLFIGSTLILCVGIWDDIRGMRPIIKLFWQIAAASVLLFFDFSVKTLSLPFISEGINFQEMGLGFLGLIIVVFWVVGLINTVNVSDGLDGLAAGICFIVAILLFWSANQIEQMTAAPAYLTVALAGAVFGFLFYNFPPAKVFMGDSGSMFLGFIIGGISIMGLLKTATVLGLVFPLLIMGLPVTDLAIAIIRRKLRGQSMTKADRGHLHHRLLDAGLTQRRAVLIMYGISIGFGLAAVLWAKGLGLAAFAILALVFSLVIIILMRRASLLAFNGKSSK